MEARACVRVVEFFSGIGGLHYALLRSSVPHRVVRAYDLDDSAVRTYRHNLPETPVSTKNIVSLKSEELLSMDADCWLLSPPCQPHTRQGLQLGSADGRSSALEHLVNLLDGCDATLLPSSLLLENVVGFESSSVRLRLYRILIRRGYRVRELWASPAQIRVPNQRTRYFLLASRDEASAALETEPPPQLAGFTLLDPVALGAACTSSQPLTPPCGEVDAETQHACGPLSDYLLPAAEAASAAARVPDHVVERYGSSMDLVSRDSRRSCCVTKNYSRYIKGAGSILCDGVAPGVALPGASDEKTLEVLLPLQPRFLLPREVANLHGFPPEFEFAPELSTKKQYELLGNSLSVDVVAALLCYLLPAAPSGVRTCT